MNACALEGGVNSVESRRIAGQITRICAPLNSLYMHGWVLGRDIENLLGISVVFQLGATEGMSIVERRFCLIVGYHVAIIYNIDRARNLTTGSSWWNSMRNVARCKDQIFCS